VVVSLGERLCGLSEHRGGHQTSDTWQGAENLDVTMPAWVLGIALEVVEQLVNALLAVSTLLRNEPQPRQ
jgi:hypothetical protein